VQLSVAARTDVGRIRAGNEDSLYADANTGRGLFIVADGMGGHAAGEVASEMAVTIVAQELAGLESIHAPDARDRLATALRHANSAIYQRTVREAEKQGWAPRPRAAAPRRVPHRPDRRLARLPPPRRALRQLTKDHSYVQEQVDAGFLTPSRRATTPYSNVITRCVGASEAVEPTVYDGEVRSRRRVPRRERRAHGDGRRPAPPAAPARARAPRGWSTR
jgi:protein phosphatase